MYGLKSLSLLTTLTSFLALSTAAPAQAPASDGQITVSSFSGSDCSAKADDTVNVNVNDVLASTTFPPVYCHNYLLPVKAMQIHLFDALCLVNAYPLPLCAGQASPTFMNPGACYAFNGTGTIPEAISFSIQCDNLS